MASAGDAPGHVGLAVQQALGQPGRATVAQHAGLHHGRGQRRHHRDGGAQRRGIHGPEKTAGMRVVGVLAQPVQLLHAGAEGRALGVALGPVAECAAHVQRQHRAVGGHALVVALEAGSVPVGQPGMHAGVILVVPGDDVTTVACAQAR